MFSIELDLGKTVLATMAGRLRRNRIKIMNGDRVSLELSPYDLTKGPGSPLPAQVTSAGRRAAVGVAGRISGRSIRTPFPRRPVAQASRRRLVPCWSSMRDPETIETELMEISAIADDVRQVRAHHCLVHNASRRSPFRPASTHEPAGKARAGKLENVTGLLRTVKGLERPAAIAACRRDGRIGFSATWRVCPRPGRASAVRTPPPPASTRARAKSPAHPRSRTRGEAAAGRGPPVRRAGARNIRREYR